MDFAEKFDKYLSEQSNNLKKRMMDILNKIDKGNIKEDQFNEEWIKELEEMIENFEKHNR